VPDFAAEILMLGSDNPTTWIIYNHLIQKFGLFPILIEKSVPRRVLFRNRLRKQGLASALSQVLFIRTIRAWLNKRDKARIDQICLSSAMEPARPVTTAITEIPSVNSDECRDYLKTLAPKVVIISGTRIIGATTLAAAEAIFINTHHGITPRYRGAHGAYWALYNNDRGNCGVTVHVVDEGIDTGGIIAQDRIDPAPADSFVTYPYLLTAKALPLLEEAIMAIHAGTLKTAATAGPSAVWYHPGFFQYLRARLRGVK
jgi:folate-dependent phosphoribosylglycinamide formyltransferase PurN